MKIVHKPEFDYLSIDFSDELESRSVFQNGIIVRYGDRGNVVGIDITDSTQFFSQKDTMTLQEACSYLGISESTNL